VSTPPFAGAAESEVLARVWCAQLRRYLSKTRGASPEQAYAALVQPHSRPGSEWPLSTAALSWLHYQRQGMHTASWKSTVLMRSRAGLDWRRCVYFEYKATRRAR